MEGNLDNHEVEARLEGQSNATTPEQGGSENSAVSEGLVKPHFSPGAPSDSVLTDSGVSEMTNTESDYSDSLEQDDEDIISSPDGAQSASSPPLKSKNAVIEFEDSGDGSWFDDQDSGDFFIDANLSHDNGIVEFDPNSEDFTNWDEVKSFFEGLIERQNTELDRISSFEYKPHAQDTYSPCRGVSSDEAQTKQKIGFSLFDNDCLLDAENLLGPFPSTQQHVMAGTTPFPAPKVIKYKYEMRDESWGYSSHEPYFDVLTGRRILSTIYEFEVSSDEDTDSVKVTDDVCYAAGSERHDEATNIIEEEEEEEEEETADEIVCGEEAKQNEKMPMQRNDVGGGDSSSAANTSSGDSASQDDIILLSRHVSTSASPLLGEEREEHSEEVGGKKSVKDSVDTNETENQEINVMEERREDTPATAPESTHRSRDEGIENEDPEFDNLVNLEATTETYPKQAVGTSASAITGHTSGGLESLGPVSDVVDGTSFGDDKIENGDGEKGADSNDKEGGTDDGDGSNPPTRGSHEVLFRNLASCDLPSPSLESVLRDDPPDLRLEARPDSPPAAGPEGEDREAGGHAAPQSLEAIVTSEGVHHEVSLREASGERKGGVISQPNEAMKDISSLGEADGDTSLCLVSPVPHRLADAPANHSSGMQKEAESCTENNKSGDEATLAQEPLTYPPATTDATKNLKEEEMSPTATDALSQESSKEPTTCESASSVRSGEENITEEQKPSEEESGIEGNGEEDTIEVGGDENADVTLRTPEPPPRPHRRAHHHDTPELRGSASASPPKLAGEADIRVINDIDVPEPSVFDSTPSGDAPMTSVGALTIPEAESHEVSNGWGDSGSSQGHPDAHTAAGDGKEGLMEEGKLQKLPEDSASPLSLEREMKEERRKDVEEIEQTVTTLHPLQQQKPEATLTATTTTTTTTNDNNNNNNRNNTIEVVAEIIPTPRDKDDVNSNNKPNYHIHNQRKSEQNPSLASPPSTVNKLHPDLTCHPITSIVTPTVNAMTTTLLASEASPQKPKRSSRSELRKQRASHGHTLDYHALYSLGGERNGGPVTPPTRPSRRKHTRGLTPPKTTSSSKIEVAKRERQNKDKVEQITDATEQETHAINDRLSNAETREEKQGSDKPQTESAEPGGNENNDRKLDARVTDTEGEQASSDSRLDTIEKIYQDDRPDGGGGGAERERGGDSGSGGAREEEEEEETGKGSNRGTISTQEEPRACASPATNTNSLDDAAADVREKRTAQEKSRREEEGHSAGIKGIIRQHESVKVRENGELACDKLKTEAAEAEKEGHQEASYDAPPALPTSPPPDSDPPATVEVLEDSEARAREELPLGLIAKWDYFGRPDAKERIGTLSQGAETKVTSPTSVSEAHVAPPRRRRKVSSSRSLQQEDAVIEPDTGQNLTRPIPPVRRKRQFSSLPRPPKPKLPPREVSPSLSTSYLALASTTEHQAATKPLRPLSFPSTSAAEIPVFPFTPPRQAFSPVALATSTPTDLEKESPVFPSTPIRPTSTPSTPAAESPTVSPSVSLSPSSTLSNSAAESLASVSYTPPQTNGVKSSRAARAKPKIKMEVEAGCSRRMSVGSTQEERKRRTLKKALRRTGSLKEMLYTQLQHRLDKSSRGDGGESPKIKNFPKLFNRKQKLYDMSCPSEHPSEIPEPAPPQQHLTSESTETFATLLSSYFPPDIEDQSKGESRSRYIAFEHSPFDPPADAKKEKEISSAEETPPRHEHVTASADISVTKALLNESFVSSSESLSKPDEGNTSESLPAHDEDNTIESLPVPDDRNTGEYLPVPDEGDTNKSFMHNESYTSVEDSPLEGDTNDKPSSQGTSDPKKSILETSPEEKNENLEENCHQPLQNIQEEAEPVKDNPEEAAEATVDENYEETTTRYDKLNALATEPDADHRQDWQTQHGDHDLHDSRGNDAPAPSSPLPPPPPTDEEGHDEVHEQEERQTRPVWEPPHVSLRTWAERQGIQSLTLPPLWLRKATRGLDREALDYYCDSDSSEDRGNNRTSEVD